MRIILSTIEESSIYSECRREGIKSVEFVRSKGKKLLFIEAKQSFPNPNNPTPNPDRGNKTGSELFQEDIIDICDRFTHSLNLYSAVSIGITEDGFPPEYILSDKVSIEFLLVINGFAGAWCNEIQKALVNRIRELIYISKIWKPEVYVINRETAVKRNLVVD